MIINYKFQTTSGKVYEGMRTEFDRNYQDEGTAMFFIEDEENTDTEGYFEVNLCKDKSEHGKLTGYGYVCEYPESDMTEPTAILTEGVEIELIQHDFDDVLELANHELEDSGLQIVLEYDGECYWAIGTENKAEHEIKWYAEGNFEHEVRDLVYECWAHARAMADKIEQSKPKPKVMYVVSYVGLSEEYQANGYSECKVFDNLDQAVKQIAIWKDAEIDNLKAEGFDYEILEDKERECRISWCGHAEQIRLQIHETEMNK